jgi:hypothetical protein
MPRLSRRKRLEWVSVPYLWNVYVGLPDMFCHEVTSHKSLSSTGYVKLQPKTWDGEQLAHRYSWKIFHPCENMPEVVMHLCDNPKCINPSHLMAGDMSLNNKMMYSRGRANLCALQDPVYKKSRVDGLTKARVKAAEVNCLFSCSQVQDIRGRYARGESQSYIASSYQVSSSTIHKIVHRKTYLNVSTTGGTLFDTNKV